MVMLVHFRGNVLPEYLEFMPFSLGLEHTHQIIILLEVRFIFQSLGDAIEVLRICFGCQKLIYVRPVGFAVKSIGH